MELKIKRVARKATYTIGHLYVDGAFFCDTIEDTDRGLKKAMTEKDVKRLKVYGKTAIPTGVYLVQLTYSPRFQRTLPAVINVKGFSGIRIHSGNTAEDSLGCIIVGENKQVGKVINSRVTLDKLMDELSKSRSTITLKIE